MSRSPAYWDQMADDWRDGHSQALWRQHADAVNAELCRRWWPAGPIQRVLKTDLFDEMAGEGLYPVLGERAGAVIGIDKSWQTVRLAIARHRAIQPASCDVRKLPFRDGTFQVVVSNSTLDHFETHEDIAASVRELHRVLAPGGRLLLTLDNPANPIVGLRNLLPFNWLKATGLVPYFVGATCSAPKGRRLLEAAGFSVRHVSAVMHCPRVLAVGAIRAIGRQARPSVGRRLLRLLWRFESLERWPLRFRTGHFVAFLADKPS